MVIDHIEKLFVTNDAATIVKALEVCIMHSAFICPPRLGWGEGGGGGVGYRYLVAF